MSNYTDIQQIEDIVSPWAEFDPRGHYFIVKDPHGFYRAMLSILEGKQKTIDLLTLEVVRLKKATSTHTTPPNTEIVEER